MNQKIQRYLLCAGAIGWGIAVAGVLLPWKWMLPILHGMGASYEFSDPQVRYWLRMACSGWSSIGLLYLAVLIKPEQYGKLIPFLAVTSIFIGIVLLVHGYLLGLSFFPFAIDVLFCLVVGIGLLSTGKK